MKVILQVHVDDDDPRYKSMKLPIVMKGLVIDGLFDDMDTWEIRRLWYMPKLNIVMAELDTFNWDGSATISQETLDRWASMARESWFETPNEAMSQQQVTTLDTLLRTVLSVRSRKALYRWVWVKKPNLRNVLNDLTIRNIVDVGESIDVMIDELLKQQGFGLSSAEEVKSLFQQYYHHIEHSET